MLLTLGLRREGTWEAVDVIQHNIRHSLNTLAHFLRLFLLITLGTATGITAISKHVKGN